MGRRLAEVASTTLDERLKSVRYRLSCCQGGCSPTRLELFWEAPAGSEGAFVEAWLDAEHRDRVVQTLDEARRAKDEE